MRILTLLLAGSFLSAGHAQTQPDVTEIMQKVGQNVAKAEARRREFVYTQKQTLRMIRSNGQIAREEHREYSVIPLPKKTKKTLVHFDGRYGVNGKFVSYDKPAYRYKGVDIDGELIDNLSDEVNAKGRRDGIDPDLFPLSLKLQRQYSYKLNGTETVRGHQVYRIHFEPLHKPHIDDVDDGAIWKGDALIDVEELQPVSVQTSMAYKIPAAVKILLGTNITGMGYSITFEKFDDGVWFPVSCGGEFDVRGLFFYKRTMTVSLVNSDFRKQDVNSSIAYTDDGKQ